MKKRAKRPTFSPAELKNIVLDTIGHVTKLMLSVHAMRLLLEHHSVLSHVEIATLEKKFQQEFDSVVEKSVAQLGQELQLAKFQKILAKHKGTIQ